MPQKCSKNAMQKDKVDHIKLCTFVVGLTAIALIPALIQTGEAGLLKQLSQAPNFTGRYIAAISDGDFLASTYHDGKLPKPEASAPDRLSIITLPLNGTSKPTAQINTSNSVTGAPHALSLAPDGKTAFVVETLGPIPPGATRREQLPPGRQLIAVNLSDPRNPSIRDTFAIAHSPETVDVHPKGNLLAISTQSPEREIILVPVQNGRFGKPTEFSLRQLGINPDPTRFQEGMYASYVQWHPSGRYLAVNLDYRDQVAFYEVQSDAPGTLRLVPWGTPVKVGKDPFSGQFTPDGRFFITSNWGRNFGKQVTTLEQRLPQARGTLSVIRLAKTQTPTSPQHRVVSTATTDISPESLTISPDSSLVVTVNMRGTLFPQTSPRFTRQASLSLLTLDSESGRLTKVGDYPFEGILPESATFDVKGNYLAVAVYDYFTPKPEGGVEIWRVKREPSLALQRTNQVIDVGQGVHQVVVAP